MSRQILLFCGLIPMIALSQDMSQDNAVDEPTCKTEFIAADASYDFHQSDLEPLEGKQIRTVHVTRLPIFDESNPDENNWLYRWANRFHSLTREDHIREQLLFKEGELYDARRTRESARLLRNLGHLYDANIHRSSTCEDEVDLEVITRDVWSLTLDASLSRSGGENDYRFGIGESNLLGTGQNISVSTEEDDERSSTTFRYSDRNIGHSRLRTSVIIQDSDDGDLTSASLLLPFFALDTKRAWGISARQSERIDTQYFRGNDVTEVRHDVDDVSVFYGVSNGLVENKAIRWSFGYRYQEHRFEAADDLPPPTNLPADRELSYPFVNLEIVQDKYVTTFNLDQINRTEDLHLGYYLNTTIGYASESLGSNQQRLVMNGEFRDTLRYSVSDGFLLQHAISWNGRYNYDTHSSEDIEISYRVSLFNSQTTHRSFYSELKLLWTDNLTSNRQVLLGGDNGVRGFDRRLQAGDRSFVLTLEERQYTNYHLLNLAYLGFALFVDVGRAWGGAIDEGFEDDYLASIGFGVRLASSKSDSARVVHIDFAFPLTNRDEPEVESSDVSLRIKSSL